MRSKQRWDQEQEAKEAGEEVETNTPYPKDVESPIKEASGVPPSLRTEAIHLRIQPHWFPPPLHHHLSLSPATQQQPRIRRAGERTGERKSLANKLSQHRSLLVTRFAKKPGWLVRHHTSLNHQSNQSRTGKDRTFQSCTSLVLIPPLLLWQPTQAQAQVVIWSPIIYY